MTLKVLLVDDDGFRSDGIKRVLEQRWSPESFNFIELMSEASFISQFETLAEGGLDLVILDQMLPYTDDESDKVYSEGRNLDAFRAGYRCFNRLRDDVRTADVPIVFYSVLDRGGIPDDVPFVKKTGDPRLSELMDVIIPALKAKLPQ